MSRTLIFASMTILVACKSEMRTTPLPTNEAARASSGSSAPPAPAATSGSASTVAGFPPLDDVCVTTADCDSTSLTPDCCMRCETSVGNKAWVAKVAAYCEGVAKSGAAAHCPPVVCGNDVAPRTATLGYINAAPHCVGGHCVKPH